MSQMLEQVSGNRIKKSRKHYLKRAGVALILASVVGIIAASSFFEESWLKIISQLICLGSFAVLFLLASILLFWEAWKKELLILGDERLQLIRENHGVVGQIPYRNIASARISKEGGLKRIEIELIDTFDHETFWIKGEKSPEWFARMKKTKNCHLTIEKVWSIKLSELFEDLNRRMAFHQRSVGTN